MLHRFCDYKLMLCQTLCRLLLNVNDSKFMRLSSTSSFFFFAVAGNYDDAIIAQFDNIQKEV